ncbi:DMT family transporter [Lysinibacillus sp. FSL R5-0849]|uniref:DMT family transporter n=1 Tax=Lysinibacillus TaxID=400634 RepID=UPI00148BC103|nr:DMT family transporter [Lysinibacillus fusiformis]NOG26094.1 DMT family transporter [Lysinibacillus fusiformis]
MNNHIKVKNFFLLTFLVIIWGIHWPLAKFSLNYSSPLLFSGLRLFIGGLILLIIAIPRYKMLRFKETWPIYFVSAFFNIILFYGLQTVGLNYLPAGLFTSIVYLQPVLMGIFSWIWLGESMHFLKFAGLILGFAGVGVICLGGLAGHISIIGVLLALCTAVSWAFGTVFMKRTAQKVDGIWLTTLHIIIGGLFLLALGTGTESWSSISWNIQFTLSLLFISIFVIAFGWLAFFTLVSSGEASKVSTYTFLIPVISILVSSFFLHEAVTINLFVGMIIVVLSIVLVNIKPKEKTSVSSA